MGSRGLGGNQFKLALKPWHERLVLCVAEQQVLDVVRDFLHLWLPDDLAALPDKVRPRKLVEPQDVTAYAFALTRARLALRGEPNPALDLMAAFLSDASMRLATLFAVEPERPASDVEPAG